jgi:transposase
MFSFPDNLKFYLYNKPTDMRKSFDGLSGIIINYLKEDPLCGHAFLFVNRNRDRMKILLWKRDGFWIFYKRLEQGTFQFADELLESKTIEMNHRQMTMLIGGIDISTQKQRKRYNI